MRRPMWKLYYRFMWFLAEAGLKCPLNNEMWLIRFLRPSKYYPESACKLVKHYYNFKVKHANVYDGLRPTREQNIFEQNILTVLPNRDQNGRRILIIELGKKWKHNKCSLDEVFKGCVLYLEAAMLEPASQIAGAVVIFDMDGLSLQQTWQFSPAFAKRIVDWLQDAMPLRIKNIHIVNQPFIFNAVFNLFKPFLREKLKSRVNGRLISNWNDKTMNYYWIFRLYSTVRIVNLYTITCPRNVCPNVTEVPCKFLEWLGASGCICWSSAIKNTKVIDLIVGVIDSLNNLWLRLFASDQLLWVQKVTRRRRWSVESQGRQEWSPCRSTSRVFYV